MAPSEVVTDPLPLPPGWRESVREACAEPGPFRAVRGPGEEERGGLRVGGDQEVRAAEAERDAEVCE